MSDTPFGAVSLQANELARMTNGPNHIVDLAKQYCRVRYGSCHTRRCSIFSLSSPRFSRFPGFFNLRFE